MPSIHPPLGYCLGVVLTLAAQAFSQRGPEPAPPTPPFLASRTVPVVVDSGRIAPPAGVAQPSVVFATVVEAPGSSWVRLRFDLADLAGSVEAGTGAYLRLTSLADGASQRLNAEHVRQWGMTSAYFNGAAVLVELIAHPGTNASRLVMSGITASDEPATIESICDGVDHRVLSSDPRVGRLAPSTCTAWIINDTNGGLLTAGHCDPAVTQVVQFNVPLSTSSGSSVAPPPEDQYAVDVAAKIVSSPTSSGNDFAYFSVFPNSNTGLMPLQRQQVRFALAAAAPVLNGQTIRVTGYGTTSLPVPSTWNVAQKTHAEAYLGLVTTTNGLTARYRVDTTNGNSGSPVIDETTGLAIAVHTHGSCSGSLNANFGTAIQHAPLQAALNSPAGVNASGRAEPVGDVFLIGDRANNLGAVDRISAISARRFGKVAQTGVWWQGLAYSWRAGAFFATTGDRKLMRVPADGGPATLLTPLQAGAPVISGLGYDGSLDRLYGVAASTGQLYRVNPCTGALTPIGAPMGGLVTALEFDPVRRTLWAIDNAAGQSVLLRIDPATGQREILGQLGASACHGLAVTADGALFTVDAATATLWNVDPVTGHAAAVGSPGDGSPPGFTGAVLATAFGMSAITPPPSDRCIADIATEGNSDPFAGPDGFITGFDFDVFVQAFFAASRCGSGPYLADVADDQTGQPVPDGFLTGVDFDAFVQAFFAGCP